MEITKQKIAQIASTIIVSVIVTLAVSWIIKKLSSIGKFSPIVPGQKIRGCDSYGCGFYGASRGSNVHKGIDVVCAPGEVVQSPISGTVTRFPQPYSNDPKYKGIEIVNDQYKVKIFYCVPFVGIGSKIKAGQSIATAQNISNKYGSGMTNHVHVEVFSITGQMLDPTKLF